MKVTDHHKDHETFQQPSSMWWLINSPGPRLEKSLFESCFLVVSPRKGPVDHPPCASRTRAPWSQDFYRVCFSMGVLDTNGFKGIPRGEIALIFQEPLSSGVATKTWMGFSKDESVRPLSYGATCWVVKKREPQHETLVNGNMDENQRFLV